MGKQLTRRTFVAGSLVAGGTVVIGGLAGCDQGTTESEPASASPSETTNPSNAADIVFKNGIVQTMVSENDTAQAVAISGNTITYVGDDAGVEEYVGDATQVIDLDGGFLAPGFMDGHIHGPGDWINRLFNVDLNEYSTNEEYVKAIKDLVEKNPGRESYFGGPFMLNAYQNPDGSNPGPQKSDLDAITSEVPIVINDISHHSVWVNSKAMEIAGITADTPDPSGGVIYRDANGEPSGCLTDTAMHLVTEKIRESYTPEQEKEALLAFMEEANSFGITGMTNMIASGVSDLIEVYDELEKEDELTVRMRFANTLGTDITPEEHMAAIENFTKHDTEMKTAGTVKMFYDGVTESATAVMLEPYDAAAEKGDSWYGEPIWSDEDFFKFVKDYDAKGFQIHIHAIGDGAVQRTIDAFEEARDANGSRDARHTITHVCAITDGDIQRMADLDIISALQFLWMYADPLYELEAAYIGEERALAMYPTKRMLDTGCLLTGASDTPVTPYNVLDEIEVGVTRNSPYAGEDTTDMYRWPEQALTAYQMLEIYTKNVAYQNFIEDMVGTIEVGKRADLVALEENILEIDPKDISDTKILYTLSDGRIVYEG